MLLVRQFLQVTVKIQVFYPYLFTINAPAQEEVACIVIRLFCVSVGGTYIKGNRLVDSANVLD